MSYTGLVDFHCHLDLYPDHAESVAECERAGIFTLAVTTTPRAWPRNNELASATRHVRAALGLHPQLVADCADEISIWEQYLPQARYIGEVGLDAGPRFYASFDRQKVIFEHVLRSCSRTGGKILTVHSVRSATTVLDMIEAHLSPARGRVVMHWFTGSKTDALRAVDLGCYFSINAEMLGQKRHRSLVAELPLDRLLTETDGPFTKTGARPSRPVDIAAVVDALARVRSIQPLALANIIRDNLWRLVST